MSDVPVEPLDRLVEGATTLEGRLVVTAGLLLVLAGAGWVSTRVRHRVDLGSENVERVVNAALALGLFVVALVVGAALLALWDLSPLAAVGITDPVLLVGRAVLSLALLLGAYVVTGVLKRLVHEFTQDRTSITPHQTELVYRTTQVGVYGLAVLATFGVWGLDLGGLLVGAGFLGIVIGLAARQTLGSLIAGFVLMFARPFEIGDWVQIGEREGIVTEISIVNTRIQTFDGEYAMIPNNTVGGSEVVNRTRKGRLRIKVDVGVDYATDLDRAIEVAVGAMRDVDAVLAVPQPRAVLDSFGDSAIVLNLRFWIDKPSARRKWRAQTAVVSAVKSAFDEAGVKIPFPQRELSDRPGVGAVHARDERPVRTEPGTDSTTGSAGDGGAGRDDARAADGDGESPEDR